LSVEGVSHEAGQNKHSMKLFKVNCNYAVTSPPLPNNYLGAGCLLSLNCKLHSQLSTKI